MMTAVVVTAPLSDQVFHAGAVGYGWFNGGWGTGAFLSALFAPQLIATVGARRSIAISMGVLGDLHDLRSARPGARIGGPASTQSWDGAAASTASP